MLRIITGSELKIILENHKLWIDDNSKGERADLSYADLSYTDLRSADLDKDYISITCIGSRKEMTTFCIEENKIWFGCWTGTLSDFKKRVKEIYKNNLQYLKEYLGFIKYVKSL